MPESLIKDCIKKIRIAIIGLGYVGLHLAVYFAKKGVKVIGADISLEKVALIEQGICPVKVHPINDMFDEMINNDDFEVTTDAVKATKKSDVIIMTVPTPLDGNKLPDLSAVIDASTTVGKGLKRGNLVIFESTVYPGVTTGIVKPILEMESKLKAGEDFGLACCCERIDPGNVKNKLNNTPRVIGGINKRSTNVAAAIYNIIMDADIVKVRNCETAEMVKLVENVYRDLNIAFANEIAILCERLGIDVLEVLDAASTKWNFHAHLPGAGVGGSCIPVNPYYLLKRARMVGLDLKLVHTARKVNDEMPYHVVKLALEALNEMGKPIKDSKIAILGLAYKADIDDDRGSPAKQIGSELSRLGGDVVFYDPLVTVKNEAIKTVNSIEEAIENATCIIVATDHEVFRRLKPATVADLAATPVAIVDGRHIFKPKEVDAAGMIYKGVGRIKDSDLNVSNIKFKAK